MTPLQTPQDSLTTAPARPALSLALTPLTLAVAIAAALSLAACGGGSDATTTDSGTGTASSTAGVACSTSHSTYNASASVKATSTATWSCSSSRRMLVSNGLPDHEVGSFPNPDCPNTIAAQSVSVSATLAPAIASSSGNPTHVIGYAMNGVKFDPGTAGSCNDSGSSCSLGGGGGGNWNIEALGQSSFNFGTDSSHAHVQPSGEYHYHGMPEGVIATLGKGKAMTLVGWAADGFPIYARYGYATAADATSALKVLSPSYQLKTTPDSGRPATSIYPMGTFTQDWHYVAGSGDLDECNGRSGVTPEFPQGIYHYLISETYPFIQRCVKGTASVGALQVAATAG